MQSNPQIIHDNSFQVVVRYLPLQQNDINLPEILEIDQQNKKITLIDPDQPLEKQKKIFSFDRIYGLQETQQTIYGENVEPLVQSVLQGFNGTLLVYCEYQRTKDYTVLGDQSNEEQIGIIPRICQQIFQHVQSHQQVEFIIKLSSCEILNENICDLLQTKNKNLNLRENKNQQIFVENLSSVVVSTEEEIIKQIQQARFNSCISSTTMNSSYVKGHTIHQIKIQQYDQTDPENCLNESILNIVILAGAERIKYYGCTGKNLAEVILTNKSLLTLEKVTTALSKPHTKHIPYRESQLTRILQNSLGGNCKTVLLTVISKERYDISLQALNFAKRAKKINNKPNLNKIKDKSAIQSFREEYQSITSSRRSSVSNLSNIQDR